MNLYILHYIYITIFILNLIGEMYCYTFLNRADLKSPSESRYLSNNSSRRTALGVMPSSVMNRRLPVAASNNSTLTSASGGGPSSHSLSQSRVSSNNKLSTATSGQNGTAGRISTNGIPVDFQHSQDPRNRLQSALKNINSSDWSVVKVKLIFHNYIFLKWMSLLQNSRITISIKFITLN